MSIPARWNAHDSVNIPMAVIRSASNYDQIPLDTDGKPIAGPDGRPRMAMDELLVGFQEAGSSFAACNAARPVLALFDACAGE